MSASEGRAKRFSGQIRETTFWGLKILWHDNGTECAGKLSIWENFSHWIDYEFVLFGWHRNWVGRGCLGCHSVRLCSNNFRKGRHYQQTAISWCIRAENCWKLQFWGWIGCRLVCAMYLQLCNARHRILSHNWRERFGSLKIDRILLAWRNFNC